MKRLGFFASGFVIAASLFGAVQIANGAGGSPSVFYGCASVKTGLITAVSVKATKCSKGSSIVSWNSQGSQGLPGAAGLQGPTGDQGVQGPQGLQGLQGPIGLPGPKGETGPQGMQGVQGPQGLEGLQGLQGPVGAAGPQGLNGDQGVQGLQGIQGLQGVQGPQGQTGAQGLQGPVGDAGLQGLKGDQGVQGPQGEPGGPKIVNDAGPLNAAFVGADIFRGLAYFYQNGQVWAWNMGTDMAKPLVYYSSNDYRNGNQYYESNDCSGTGLYNFDVIGGAVDAWSGAQIHLYPGLTMDAYSLNNDFTTNRVVAVKASSTAPSSINSFRAYPSGTCSSNLFSYFSNWFSYTTSKMWEISPTSVPDLGTNPRLQQ